MEFIGHFGFVSIAILATIAAILFGWEIDNVDVVNRNYVLSRGVSFYLQVNVLDLEKSVANINFHFVNFRSLS